MQTHSTRRQFMALAAATASISVAHRAGAAGPGAKASHAIPRRPLGKTGATVPILGLGGFHLGSIPDANEATRIVHEAIDAGANFFDNAWEYHDGKSEEVLGRALAGGWRQRAFLMTKVCTHGRGADVAMQQLEDSLRRLGTDHLDLWQIHECVYDSDPDLHFAAEGVVHALARAKEQGKVRFVGFTGHKDPGIHLRMLAGGFRFDTVQMPLNCFDASFRSFERRVLPQAIQLGVAPIGMKSLTGQGDPVRKGVVTADEALRYAMSIPGVATTVTGVDSLDVLRQNVAIARGFEPTPAAAMQALRDRVATAAGDGRFEWYKTTTHFDAKVGREQHGYPTTEELPL
ncbi:MAG TPA: aldo/keto reductase [Polyangiaceae bacterium]